MHRWIVTIEIAALAACSGSPTSPDATEPPPSVSATTRPIIHGAHGNAIDIVAASADGRAAVTQDADGNTRLWPALDGTAEPIVLHIATAAELAIVRDGDDALVGSLDPAGGLQLVRVARDGTPRVRVGLTGVGQLAATSHELLALRDDQTISVIAGDGASRGVLAAVPGERVVSLVTRGDRALAVVQRGADQHARAIDLEHLTWGDALATFHAVTPRFALSPNGEMLAMAIAPGTVAEVELTTNKQFGLCSGGRSAQLPLAYIDDATIACFAFGQVNWYPVAGGTATFVHDAAQPELVAYGGDQQISGEGQALGIARRHSMQYLGYAVTDPSTLHASPAGLVFLQDDVPVLVLDHTLAARREIALAPVFSDALPLDATHVLRSDAALGKGFTLSIVEPATKHTEKIATSTDYKIEFDPAAKLLAVPQTAQVAVLPYDPTHHRFGSPTVLEGGPGRVYLTDPDLADGIAAVVIENRGGVADNVRVREYRARDIDRGGIATAARGYDVGGDVIAVDRAARIYLATGSNVQSYIGGDHHAPILVAKAAFAGRPVIAPNLEATAVVVLGDNRMTLMDSDGHVRWSVAVTGAVDAGWVDGQPYVRFGSGLATVDVRTGALRERRCGWQFGLVTTKLERSGNAVSVCDAE
jgi:hypothetical protein